MHLFISDFTQKLKKNCCQSCWFILYTILLQLLHVYACAIVITTALYYITLGLQECLPGQAKVTIEVCYPVCVAGTTDNPCSVTDNPTPTEAEIQFILQEIRNYLNPDVNGMLTLVQTCQLVRIFRKVCGFVIISQAYGFIYLQNH